MRLTSAILLLVFVAPCLGGDVRRRCKAGGSAPPTTTIPEPSSTTAPASGDLRSITPSSTTNATGAPTGSPSGGAPNKCGLPYNDPKLTKSFNSAQVSWAYNWASAPSGELPSGVTFFPMLWGTASTGDWQKNAEAALSNGATHLLGFNEPDIKSQSNIAPADAAKLWMQHMQPFAGRATLVSPAITNGAPPAMGTGWLDQFLAECDRLGCTVDAVAAHIYASAKDTAYWKKYITDLGTRYEKPVLITEFNGQGSVEEQQAFLEEMIPFLDGLESVSHYAWFMTAVGNLVNEDGGLTALGETYVST